MEIKNRKGVLRLDRSYVDYNTEEVLKLMAEMIVVRAELEYHTDEIVYHVLSYNFDELEEGCCAPEYKAEIRPAGNIIFTKR